MNDTKKLTLIGIGNRYRNDDGVGVRIIEKLREQSLPDVETIAASGEGAALIDLMQDKQSVILFDAVSSGAEPGTIFRFAAHAEPIPTKFFNYSTHAFSLAEAIELARAMGQLPEKLIVYGIEGKSFEAGTNLSPEVEKAALVIVAEVLTEIESDPIFTAETQKHRG